MLHYNCIICNKKTLLIKNHLKNTHSMKLDKYPNEVSIYNTFFENNKQNRKGNSPNSINFYLKKGFDIDAAKIELEKHRKELPFSNRKDCKPSQIKYWMKLGFTEDESIYKVKLFNTNNLQTLIIKYGIEKGTFLYNKFVSSLKDRKETEINNIMMNDMIIYEEAEIVYNNKKSNCSPRTIEYWVNKGYDISDATNKVSEYQDNNSINSIMLKHNISFDEAVEKQNGIINKILKTNEKNKRITPIENKKDFLLYKYLVIKETNTNYRLYKNTINPLDLNRASYDYHLDHIYSICEGYLNNVDPKIIGSVYNLRMLFWKENLNKSIKCDISLTDLINKNK